MKKRGKKRSGTWGKYPTQKEQKRLDKEMTLYKSTLDVENQRLRQALGRAETQIIELKRMVRDITYSYGDKKGVKSITIEFDHKPVEEEAK